MSDKFRVLDLFSGIGGFSLGLERTGGFETVAFCEIEEFPRKVLAKHWPDVPCYRDVRELTAAKLAADGIAVNVICGGFPCQDISFAGKGAGLAGERSGLFYEIARLVGELGPELVILENVGALLSRGLDAVLGTLASIGYDAEWHCIPASAVGAPHIRDRAWIVAHRNSQRYWPDNRLEQNRQAPSQGEGQQEERERLRCLTGGGGKALANTTSERRSQRLAGRSEVLADSQCLGRNEVVTPIVGREAIEGSASQAGDCSGARGWQGWLPEPNVGRVANGVPNRVDRLKALGNAVVPQIPELIGHAILEARRA